MSGPSDTVSPCAFSRALKLLVDPHHRTAIDEIEQLDDVAIRHANAADRARHAERLRVRHAVQVDVAPHRIDRPQAILADLGARQPEDTRQDPVAARLRARELGRVYLARRPPPAEHGTERRAGADLGADDVTAARRLVTVAQLARAVLRRRHGVAADEPSCAVVKVETLGAQADDDLEAAQALASAALRSASDHSR